MSAIRDLFTLQFSQHDFILSDREANAWHHKSTGKRTRSRIVDMLIPRVEEVLHANKTHTISTFDNLRALLLLHSVLCRAFFSYFIQIQACSSKVEIARMFSGLNRPGFLTFSVSVWSLCSSALMPFSQLALPCVHMSYAEEVSASKSIHPFAAIRHLFQLGFNKRSTILKIVDESERGLVVFTWWLACLSDAHTSLLYRTFPMIQDADYDIEPPPAWEAKAEDGTPHPLGTLSEVGFRFSTGQAAELSTRGREEGV